jgi:hypothetical protein
VANLRPYTDFTAQGINVRALMSLYAELERDPEKTSLTPFVVFLAFSVESYLNSLGARQLPIWDELERLPWKSKITILHKVAGATPKWGEEPLVFASEVFKLRDKLAHGKPERVFDTLTSMPGEVPIPTWFAGINRAWVLNAKQRFRSLMVYLASLFGLHESDHLLLSSGRLVSTTSDDA